MHVRFWEKNSNYVLYWDSFDHNWGADKYGTFKMTEFVNRYRSLDNKFESDYPGLTGKKLSVRQFVNAALELEKKKESLNLRTQGEVMDMRNTNYILTLAEAFGGSSGLTYLKYNSKTEKYYEVNLPPRYTANNSVYFDFDSDFISRSKVTYKSYLNSIQNQTYISAKPEDRSPSGTIGFIPIGFDLTLQGISGIKIYNKLNINSNFLPAQYPKALKFLITQVNHKISNNKWETSLGSLSIPKTAPYKKIDLSYTTNVDKSNDAPLEDQKPLYGEGELIIMLNYGMRYKNLKLKRKKIVTLEQLLPELNPSSRKAFESFFKDMQQNYKGYTVLVNAIGRSLKKSEVLLKTNDPKNAKPGRSKHNYFASIDFNVIEPSGAYLKKRDAYNPGKVRTQWVNQGFEKLAKKHNLIWGGNFKDNEDCVHFAYKFPIDTAVANAIKKYGEIESTGVPNLKDSNGREVELNKLV